MESAKSKMRAILPIGKYRVVDIIGNDMKIHMGGTTTMTVSLSDISVFDIREGDILTFYTEVLFKEPH